MHNEQTNKQTFSFISTQNMCEKNIVLECLINQTDVAIERTIKLEVTKSFENPSMRL